MKISENYSTLVIIGSWNKNIFTEDWIRNNLLDDKEFTLQYLAYQNYQLQFIRPKITFQGVEIIILEERILFNLLKTADENFNLIQNLSLKLADKLPDTPVSSYGVNFKIEGKGTEKYLLNLIQPGDLEQLKTSNITVNSEQYVRQLILDEKILNFTTIIENNQINFDFNFDFEIRDLAEFKEKISQNSILQLKKEAVNFVSKFYLIQ
ncbi:MAG: hypothetical protein OXU51_11370 [Candidatus Poribacteria bacterium]|nr:hypothetical protein [Candidatus Poribacteria bacterium]